MGKAASRIKCLSFVDSEPAKFGLIKGMPDTQPCDILIRSIALWDYDATPWIWYSRVPSFPILQTIRLDVCLISLRRNFQRPFCAMPQITSRHHQSLSDARCIKLVVGLTLSLYLLSTCISLHLSSMNCFTSFTFLFFIFRFTFLRSAVRLCIL